MSGFNGARQFTLCWDCKNATSSKCPWVDRFEPVEGWCARHHRVSGSYFPYDSYCVIRCPLFKRDADRGGQTPYPKPLKGDGKNEKRNSNKRGTPVPVRGVVEPTGYRSVDDVRRPVVVETGWRQRVLDQPNRDVFDLAYVILERAVEDWKALDYGRRSEVIVDKELVERDEVVEFFFSKWFEILLNATLPYTPAQIRRYIHMPENIREILDCAEGRL